MIDFLNVSMTYPNGYQALRHVSFSINAGEMVMLCGPSGAGKSSIFNLLLRLVLPSQGRVSVNNTNLCDLKPAELPRLRRYISMVFQNPQLLLEKRVFDNVALPLVVAGYRTPYIHTRVNAALKKVGLLSVAALKAVDLSSGQKKLVEIARAIVTMPKILLVDEPTSNVDADTAIKILELFRAFNQVGITLLVATHQQHLLTGKQVRSLVFQDGVLQQEFSREPVQ